jgi:hypothetical protein
MEKKGVPVTTRMRFALATVWTTSSISVEGGRAEREEWGWGGWPNGTQIVIVEEGDEGEWRKGRVSAR